MHKSKYGMDQLVIRIHQSSSSENLIKHSQRLFCVDQPDSWLVFVSEIWFATRVTLCKRCNIL